ncbi:MAG: sugar phosphate isomerase/epimerase [Patescibacteria group bacterium]
MHNNQFKLCAKGSRRIGAKFVAETEYLAGLVNCLEIDCNYPHDRNFQRELSYLTRLHRNRHINFTVHAQYVSGGLNDLNPRIRQETLRQAFYAIDCAAKIGSEVVTMHPALEPYGWKLSELPTLELTSYRRIAKYAARKKIKIGLENEAQTCFWFPDRACRIQLLVKTIEAVSSPNFGLTLDIGHANISSEDYLSTIKKYRNHIFHIHIHDNWGGPANNLKYNHRPDPHLAPGHGKINWRQVKKAIRQIDYRGYVELECEIKDIAAAIKYFQKL